ncbi:MAG: ion transporter, partial [Flavobacteriales bacterium]|nr:ion transporter [Flavobacteriales bacterium]
EYGLRLWVSEKPTKYAFSFLGIVDLLAIVPTYLSLIVVGSQFLLVVRAIRLLRVFRILKLVRYLKGAQLLVSAMKASKEKIFVFISAVLTVVVILGTLMYLIEGGENGFDSIPRSIYWAIVTLTTVGYGDIAPATTIGQFLAAFIMIMGYGMIAVPTGIVGVEVAKASKDHSHIKCKRCGESEHISESRYCHRCGEEISTDRSSLSEPPND